MKAFNLKIWKRALTLTGLVVLLTISGFAQKEKTFCNPVNLNYRFQSSYREAADPVMMVYKGKYMLFASHSGGYWYSDDLLDWKFLPIHSFPITKYAPAVATIRDTVFYVASSRMKDYIYYSTNPFEDNWKPMKKKLPMSVWDPCFFQDDNKDVFLYWGCSDKEPIKVVQLNAEMQPMSDPKVMIEHNPNEHGWEVFGESNETGKNGFNEGAWMTKHNNKYYLQYASNGTQFKLYADGVYTADSPMGPFKYENYSPFCIKPGGFIGGTGHSSTFEDKYGNYWHVTSLSIASRGDFERRLGLFPASFDNDGVLRTYTAFGDYPMTMPTRKMNPKDESLFKGWMLLSYNKKATASSTSDDYPVENAFDENVKTWWSAKTGNKGEWLSVEIGNNATVNAIQINFADHLAVLNSDEMHIYCYRVLASNDQKNWKVIIDKSNNTKDACHDYVELEKPVRAKYLKIENVKVPDGKFSIYDLRIFGLKKGKTPIETKGFEVNRNADSRKATVTWTKDKSATGYIVNYGVDANKLYTSFMVYDCDSVKLTGLNKDIPYYFSIDAFNESGITKGKKIISIK